MRRTRARRAASKTRTVPWALTAHDCSDPHQSAARHERCLVEHTIHAGDRGLDAPLVANVAFDHSSAAGGFAKARFSRRPLLEIVEHTAPRDPRRGAARRDGTDEASAARDEDAHGARGLAPGRDRVLAGGVDCEQRVEVRHLEHRAQRPAPARTHLRSPPAARACFMAATTAPRPELSMYITGGEVEARGARGRGPPAWVRRARTSSATAMSTSPWGATTVTLRSLSRRLSMPLSSSPRSGRRSGRGLGAIFYQRPTGPRGSRDVELDHVDAPAHEEEGPCRSRDRVQIGRRVARGSYGVPSSSTSMTTRSSSARSATASGTSRLTGVGVLDDVVCRSPRRRPGTPCRLRAGGA
jgi:hypothetical protein